MTTVRDGKEVGTATEESKKEQPVRLVGELEYDCMGLSQVFPQGRGSELPFVSGLAKRGH